MKPIQLISSKHLTELSNIIRLSELDTANRVNELPVKFIPELEDYISSYAARPTQEKRYLIQGLLRVERP